MADRTRAALEAALREHPDDLTTAMAYADYLSEQGDPRGEFISVQIALEDSSLPASERARLATREDELLAAHARTWLGRLAPYLLDQDKSNVNANYYAEDQSYQHRWQRGFLAAVEVYYLTRRFAQALVDEPAAHLLRELRIIDDAGTWGEIEIDPPPPQGPKPSDVREHLALFELIRAPFRDHLRLLQLGDESGGETGWTDCHRYLSGVETFVAVLPRIEELVLLAKGYAARPLFALDNLTHLRILQIEHLDDYPLDVLAANPALANLTHLWLHPHFSDAWDGEDGYLPCAQLEALVRSPHLKKLSHLRFRVSSAGDEGVRLLIESGFLAQLRLLDLRHGRVTDAGARLLAECPAARQLELLDLGRNQLTAEGIALLQGAGIHLRADDQHPVGSTDYLQEGDFE